MKRIITMINNVCIIEREKTSTTSTFDRLQRGHLIPPAAFSQQCFREGE